MVKPQGAGAVSLNFAFQILSTLHLWNNIKDDEACELEHNHRTRSNTVQSIETLQKTSI